MFHEQSAFGTMINARLQRVFLTFQPPAPDHGGAGGRPIQEQQQEPEPEPKENHDVVNFLLFIQINQINQINQIIQINQINQINQIIQINQINIILSSVSGAVATGGGRSPGRPGARGSKDTSTAGGRHHQVCCTTFYDTRQQK